MRRLPFLPPTRLDSMLQLATSAVETFPMQINKYGLSIFAKNIASRLFKILFNLRSNYHMKTLYIIGNGFDLWHDLPTGYNDFYDFAKGFLDEIEEYYSFDLRYHQPWHDFENALGNFDAENFLSIHNEVDVNSEDFRPRDIYGLEDELTEQTKIHVSNIEEAFTDWVNSIDVTDTEQKIIFNTNSTFINFNYTSTLQSVYNIEDDHVLHIHGSAARHNALIFGHGENITEPSEFDKDGEYTGHMFSEAESIARYPLYALRKPVEAVLEKNEEYFYNLNNINDVVIIGHSLNNIDLPYFQRIKNQVGDVMWKVYCYQASDKEKHIQSLLKCGVSRGKIEIITYDEL
ncbi:bacteriophage abortive infection AbiH family protein [Aeromonas veronii]|uniref:bacteriophage abortive infection AbiH family protein n=1 Tax=Aeromonas veronii TaxID=654 RepID=UPI003F67FDCE